MTFCAAAEEYSGWKLNGVPSQVVGLVFMNPLAAEAIMKPRCPVVWSDISASSACPLRTRASNRRTVITSPGLISSVCRLGVTVASSLSCGLGGPVGTPLVWTKPKFTGSGQLALHGPALNPLPWHSALSIVSAEHQCASSQLMWSENGATPGG